MFGVQPPLFHTVFIHRLHLCSVFRHSTAVCHLIFSYFSLSPSEKTHSLRSRCLFLFAISISFSLFIRLTRIINEVVSELVLSPSRHTRNRLKLSRLDNIIKKRGDCKPSIRARRQHFMQWSDIFQLFYLMEGCVRDHV